jgi:hypothetical protein
VNTRARAEIQQYRKVSHIQDIQGKKVHGVAFKHNAPTTNLLCEVFSRFRMALGFRMALADVEHQV